MKKSASIISKSEIQPLNLISIFLTLFCFVLLLLPGFKHVAKSYYYNSSTGYISDKDFSYQIFKCIFGGTGYSYGPDVKAFFPLVLGFLALVAFFFICMISTVLIDKKDYNSNGIQIVQLSLTASATFFLSPIFSGIAVSNYNGSIGSKSTYGQNFNVRITFWFVLMFITLLVLTVIRIVILRKTIRDN